eukprot:TRINITY_DN20859_c0_g2_i1.p1 TRINITY_DN20859_c0_g2~~TRINITY_DN20859_c0_g2_i1.p1  ORF type:complete len:174 (+),score=43.79 TRINITY_DN20859_c0_g2_i1:60-581(+)
MASDEQVAVVMQAIKELEDELDENHLGNIVIKYLSSTFPHMAEALGQEAGYKVAKGKVERLEDQVSDVMMKMDSMTESFRTTKGTIASLQGSITGMNKKARQVSAKEVAHLRPTQWLGPKEKQWTIVSGEFKNWAVGVRPRVRTILIEAESLGFGNKMENSKEFLKDNGILQR